MGEKDNLGLGDTIFFHDRKALPGRDIRHLSWETAKILVIFLINQDLDRGLFEQIEHLVLRGEVLRLEYWT